MTGGGRLPVSRELPVLPADKARAPLLDRRGRGWWMGLAKHTEGYRSRWKCIAMAAATWSGAASTSRF